MAQSQSWHGWSSDSASQALVARFAEAWQSAAGTERAPNIDQFAPAPSDPRRGETLPKLIALDLQNYWQRQKPTIVEQYLDRYPELNDQPGVVAGLLYTEFKCRHAHGDKPALKVYETRFPECYSLLQSLSDQALPEDFATLTSGPRGDTRPDLVPIDDLVLDNLGESAAPAPALEAPSFALPTSSTEKQPPRPGPSQADSKAAITPPIVVDSASKPASHPDPLGTTPSKSGAGTGASPPPLSGRYAELVSQTGYRLIEYLGRGQFGEVWRAEAPGGITTAVKIITRSLDDATSQRELQALEIIRNLNHPYLLSTHAYWSLQDHLVIAMRLADGSLTDRLKECKKAGLSGVPSDELLGYFKCAADGLDFLHRHKVQHRDVKPDNLLLLKGIVQVADFGLVRLQEEGQVATVTFCGTPAFMAPEMWHNKATLASDQYSLAVSYVKLRTGELPFASKSMMELMLAHCSEPPKLDLLEEAERKVLTRALAKTAEERYPSCRAFVDALAEAVSPAVIAPPPEPLRMTRRYFLGAVGLTAVAGATLLYLKGPPKEQVRCPRDCQPLPGTEVLTSADGRQYYKMVQYPLDGAAPLTFVAIPQQKNDGIATFYMLATKVTVGQFKAYLQAGPQRRATLKSVQDPAKADDAHPALNLDAKDQAVPILNVRIEDAYAFAKAFGGQLPTSEQWNKASGKLDKDQEHSEGPYVGKFTSRRAGEFYLGHLGPVWKSEPQLGTEPDWETPADTSPYGVHHMAANGWEWVVESSTGFEPQGHAADHAQVIVHGADIDSSQPDSFSDKWGYHTVEINDPPPEIGFRIVLLM